MATTTENQKNRKWWVAFLLTFFAGGTGYLYSGHPKRFLGYVGVFAAILVLTVLMGFRLAIDPLMFLIIIAVLLLTLYLMAFDSGILAHRQRDFVFKWYNKWWVYLLVYVFLYAVIFMSLNKNFAAVRSYNIPAESMAPTVMVGDYIFADPYAYESNLPNRGDVVIFKLPSDPRTDYIKRVVGLPGDEVQFKDGQLYLNGNPVTQQEQENKLTVKEMKDAKVFREILPSGKSYQTLSLYEDLNPGADNTKVYLVPAGHYFVSGDNRDNSNDSRYANGVGFVPQKNIYAKAKIIFWANDLNRIGTLLNPQ